MALQGKLSHPKRFITTHDPQGQAVFSQAIPTEAPFYELPNKDAGFAQCYVTNSFPAELGKNADIGVYQHYLNDPPGLTVSGGTVLRYVDIPPAHTSPMHRTISLDYGVVLEGGVELILDSGETRELQRGDICIQRATMHAWRNLSQTEWARMLYVLQPAQPLTAAGHELREDYGGMHGVKESA